MASYRCDVLKVIKTVPAKKKEGAGTQLRVVQWVFPQGSSVKVEKRGYYTKDGKVRPGKAEGFGKSDFKDLKDNWKEISFYLQNPPTPKPLGRQADEEPEMQEVPF